MRGSLGYLDSICFEMTDITNGDIYGYTQS